MPSAAPQAQQRSASNRTAHRNSTSSSPLTPSPRNFSGVALHGAAMQGATPDVPNPSRAVYLVGARRRPAHCAAEKTCHRRGERSPGTRSRSRGRSRDAHARIPQPVKSRHPVLGANTLQRKCSCGGRRRRHRGDECQKQKSCSARQLHPPPLASRRPWCTRCAALSPASRWTPPRALFFEPRFGLRL